MIYESDIILPDGRIVHARVAATYEHDTNATNIISCDLSWPDGKPLIADEYNQRFGDMYLHEFATDKVLLAEPYYED